MALVIHDLRINARIVRRHREVEELHSQRREFHKALAESFKKLSKGSEFVEFSDIFYDMNPVITGLEKLEETYSFPSSEQEYDAGSEDSSSRWSRWRRCFENAAERCRARRARDAVANSEVTTEQNSDRSVFQKFCHMLARCRRTMLCCLGGRGAAVVGSETSNHVLDDVGFGFRHMFDEGLHLYHPLLRGWGP